MAEKSRILIVDDDQDLCNTLSDILSAAGYEVSSAYDGIAGVMLAHRFEPDVIILDIKMPCGDGISVYNRLKLSSYTRDIPIIFISGYYEGEVTADLFIRKPFDPDELIAYVKDVLREKTAKAVRKEPDTQRMPPS